MYCVRGRGSNYVRLLVGLCGECVVCVGVCGVCVGSVVCGGVGFVRYRVGNKGQSC